MDKRKAVEKIVGRLYRHYEKTTGRLPDGKAVRDMEVRVEKAAEKADNKRQGR
ncbi:MAG: hypothetical protein HY887_05055 [Deltaproteobacteria bacterium]|nr:hypothetical protein [Deltaproteobacteria bacterium]